MQPTAKREGFSVVPDVTWEDIGALVDLKKNLENAIIKPIQEPESFEIFNIAPEAGVLLYGPRINYFIILLITNKKYF